MVGEYYGFGGCLSVCSMGNAEKVGKGKKSICTIAERIVGNNNKNKVTTQVPS